jgi:hypothetical protein
MKLSFLLTIFFLLSCSDTVKSESKNLDGTLYLPEIQYLIDSHVPLSKEMREKKYPDTWKQHEESDTSKYTVRTRTSAIDRDLSITIIVKEKLNGFGGGFREKKFYFEKGEISRIVYTEPFNVPDQGSFAGDYGIRFDFKEGRLDTVGCYFQQDLCDQIIYLNPKGEVTKVTKEKTQCKKGCGHLVPYRIPGSYFIADNKVRVRKEPSTQADILTELRKDTPIEVIADAEVYEEVFPHYGTWGKVKLDDGREGFVYGAFLRAPGEPDVVAIREKAEEWKKKNGWKGK